jgi:hypothetical protein
MMYRNNLANTHIGDKELKALIELTEQRAELLAAPIPETVQRARDLGFLRYDDWQDRLRPARRKRLEANRAIVQEHTKLGGTSQEQS